jgi:palmitoyltransferase
LTACIVPAIWTYTRVIVTGPGYVRDHIPISEAPTAPTEYQPAAPASYPAPLDETNNTSSDPASEQTMVMQEHSEESTDPSLPAFVGPLAAGGAAKADEEKAIMREEKNAPIHQPSWQCPQQTPVVMTANGVPEPFRVPPQSGPLNPNNLYCYRCKRYKPPRAHHCRHCATCVLKMDHHCPWVGGCVGARNHKFFYHFLQWVTLLELFVLVTNAFLFSRGIHRRSAGGSGWPVDGYMISLFPM